MTGNETVDARAGFRWWALHVGVVLVAAMFTLGFVGAGSAPLWAKVSVNAVLVLLLLLRHRQPLVVFVTDLAIAVAVGWWLLPAIAIPALLVAFFSTVAACSRRAAWTCFVVFELACLAASWHMSTTPVAPAIALTVFVSGSMALGLYESQRRAMIRRLRAERDREGELAAVAERARIAREMHDVVAHNLSVMVRLSDGAATVAAHRPGLAAQLMRTVSDTGREALSDTRNVLGLLRQTDDQTQPAPGAVDLPALFTRVRTAGLAVEVDDERADELAALPESTQLTVYRIVQESLTNTLKHAGRGARSTVRLTGEAGSLSVDIRDDGGRAPVHRHTVDGPPGRGLTGMHDRADAVGGWCQAGPEPDGGWRVRAWLPAPGAEPDTTS